MADENTGPSFENLLKLRDALPKLAHDLTHKKIGGKGRPVIPQARKTCTVCCKLYDFVTTKEDVLLQPVPCETCQKELDAGYVAMVGGDKYAFVKSKRLADLAGRVVHVPPHVMEKINDAFALEWKTQESHDEKTPPFAN